MSGTQTLRDLVGAVEQVLVGKHAEAEQAIIGLAAAGHLLIEDVPGVGKTMLAKSLARATGCTFKRIQFTPDLLPSDVTGVSIYNQRTGEFEFRAGPIVAHVVQDSVGAPGSDGGAAGHGRGHYPAATLAVHRAGYPESDRVRGHVSVA